MNTSLTPTPTLGSITTVNPPAAPRCGLNETGICCKESDTGQSQPKSVSPLTLSLDGAGLRLSPVPARPATGNPQSASVSAGPVAGWTCASPSTGRAVLTRCSAIPSKAGHHKCRRIDQGTTRLRTAPIGRKPGQEWKAESLLRTWKVLTPIYPCSRRVGSRPAPLWYPIGRYNPER